MVDISLAREREYNSQIIDAVQLKLKARESLPLWNCFFFFKVFKKKKNNNNTTSWKMKVESLNAVSYLEKLEKKIF